jgi:hypothetical protein
MIRRLVRRWWWLAPLAYMLAMAIPLRIANWLDTIERRRR